MLLRDESPDENPARMFVGYGVMIVAAIGLFFVIRSYGETLMAPAPAPAESAPAGLPPAAAQHTLFHVLLALSAVIVLGRVLGKLFGHLGQPPVIGEVVAGICLGPSLLGHLRRTPATICCRRPWPLRYRSWRRSA